MNYRNFASQPPAYLYGGSLRAEDLKSAINPEGGFSHKKYLWNALTTIVVVAK